MTDFVIIALATLALSAPPPAGATAGTDAALANADTAPTIGFVVHPSAEACQHAAATLVMPPGRRAVCVPVEPAGDMAQAN